MVRAKITTLLGSLILGGSLLIMLVILSMDLRNHSTTSGKQANQISSKVAAPGGVNLTANSSPAASSANSGPVRLARFSYVNGKIVWRSQSSGAWAPAAINMPIRQGSQIWVNGGGRAEIQFDDGSLLRLGTGALSTLTTLYSDSQGEFTEITMQNGLATVVTRHANSIYQIDTPFVSIKANRASQIRVGVDGVAVSVQYGAAIVDGHLGAVNLQTGNYLNLQNNNSPYIISSAPPEDSWDRWNDQRDKQFLNTNTNLPSNISLVAGNLNEYGSWRNVPRHGNVWVPREDRSNWRPYHNGRWVWVDPFGWTWVSNEPWGWAPYHYGTWTETNYGWGWVPGPKEQYWSPAVVDFSVYNGEVAWAPLSPEEVRYPANLSVGFASGNWALSFSIGGAANYYYGRSRGRPVFLPTPYNTTIINQTNITNNYFGSGGYPLTAYQRFTQSPLHYASEHQRYDSGRYVPVNARTAFGASVAPRNVFCGAGNYRSADRSAAAIFQRGKAADVPQEGIRPLAGPVRLQPTSISFLPTRSRSNVTPPNSFMGRGVYRAPLPSIVRKGMLAQNAQAQRNGNAPRHVAANVRAVQNRYGSYFAASGSHSNRAARGLSAVQKARMELGQPGIRTAFASNSNGSKKSGKRNRSGISIQPRNSMVRYGGRQITHGNLVTRKPQRSSGAANAAERARQQLVTHSGRSRPIHPPSHNYNGFQPKLQHTAPSRQHSAPNRHPVQRHTQRSSSHSAPNKHPVRRHTQRSSSHSAPNRHPVRRHTQRSSSHSAPNKSSRSKRRATARNRRRLPTHSQPSRGRG